MRPAAQQRHAGLEWRTSRSTDTPCPGAERLRRPGPLRLLSQVVVVDQVVSLTPNRGTRPLEGLRRHSPFASRWLRAGPRPLARVRFASRLS